MDAGATGAQEARSRPDGNPAIAQVTAPGATAAPVLYASVRASAVGYVHAVDSGRRGVRAGRAAAIDAQGLSRILATAVAKTAVEGRLRRCVPRFSASAC